MPKPKSELMARTRAERATQGLKRVEVWVPKGTEQQVRDLAERLRDEAGKAPQ